ncbi:transcription termination/antitermination protein NusG [Consotaella aegiceratis]|uniref:transcription termination/antitermination protein NusG n=1 Tax=Consotaella aegiceratis TaxID=3097961 RepID=UPI002F3F0566
MLIEQATFGAVADWYAVQCQAGRETWACHNLERQGFATFVPKLRRSERRRNRIVDGRKALFPGYLFVSFDRKTMPWRSINGTFGVKRMVIFGDVPEPVPHAVMVPLIQACDADGIFSFRRIMEFQAGDIVKLADGPFLDSMGAIEELDGHDRAKVLIEVLGRITRVDVSLDQLHKVI